MIYLIHLLDVLQIKDKYLYLKKLKKEKDF